MNWSTFAVESCTTLTQRSPALLTCLNRTSFIFVPLAWHHVEVLRKLQHAHTHICVSCRKLLRQVWKMQRNLSIYVQQMSETAERTQHVCVPCLRPHITQIQAAVALNNNVDAEFTHPQTASAHLSCRFNPVCSAPGRLQHSWPNGSHVPGWPHGLCFCAGAPGDVNVFRKTSQVWTVVQTHQRFTSRCFKLKPILFRRQKTLGSSRSLNASFLVGKRKRRLQELQHWPINKSFVASLTEVFSFCSWGLRNGQEDERCRTHLQKWSSKPSHLSLHFRQAAPAPNSCPKVIWKQSTWETLWASLHFNNIK